MKKPFAVLVLALFHILVGISAVAGGLMLVIKPDGSLLGMQPGWLGHSPFTTYFLPGLILLFVNGVFPLVIIAGLLFKAESKLFNRINIYKGKHWAWTCSLYAGIILITWIIIQQLIANYFWLQPVIASIGLLIIIFSLLPSVMKYYSVEE